jgi:3-hydroxybutyryl-CoA dehydrogenase
MPTLQGGCAAAVADQIGSSSLTLRGRPFTPQSSRIAVLGAGLMGPGIAQVFAEAGFEVDLCEISQSAVDRGMNSLRGSLDLKVELNLLTDADAAAALARVTPHTNSDPVIQQATLIIEAATEDRGVKKSIYDRVLQLSGPDTVVWSNTSTLNVFDLAEPAFVDRLLVAHWFAPPQILPLVEVVQHGEAQQSLRDESVAILRALGKAPVVLDKFIPGFIINRLLRALGREAFDMIEAGVISIENMDVAVRTSLAPRMQVLGLMQRYDFTGLNLSLRNLNDRDIVDAPVNMSPALLHDRVQRGDLGVSTGRGFYDYEGRSTLQLQRERDLRLWQAVQRLSDLVFDPKPI